MKEKLLKMLQGKRPDVFAKIDPKAVTEDELLKHIEEATESAPGQAQRTAKPEALDPKFLKGLTFNTNREVKRPSEDGKEVSAFVPDQVPLKPEHVLSFADKGSHVVIVTADGRKHKVKK